MIYPPKGLATSTIGILARRDAIALHNPMKYEPDRVESSFIKLIRNPSHEVREEFKDI